MKLCFNAEQFCAVCVLTWPGPLPPFKGVQGILPEGVKNVVKWKSWLGLKKILKQEKNRLVELEKEKLLKLEELNDVMLTIHFYTKSISVLCDNNYLISFFEGLEEDLTLDTNNDIIKKEGYVSLKFLNDAKDYEINNYITKKEMYDDIKQSSADILKRMDGKIVLKVCWYDEHGKIKCEIIGSDSWEQNLDELLKEC